MKTAPPTTALRLRILDVLRGLAALYVVLGHARYLLHEGLKDGYRLHPETYSWWQKFLVHALGGFGWGYEAVILFFVLSGFAIHYRHARELAAHGHEARLHPGDYFLRRAKRLYPPLLLALFVTFGLDTLGAGMGWKIHKDVGAIHHDAKTLAGNLLFLMDNGPGAPFACFGSDNPLWSLRYETAFYLIYPLLWLGARRSPWLIPPIALGLAFLPDAVLGGAFPHSGVLLQPLQMLAVWWMGAFLADLFTERIKIAVGWLAPLTLLLVVGLRLPGQETALLPKPFSTLALGFGFAGLIALLLAGYRLFDRWRWLSPFGSLGDCSYTLYVIHMPILVLVGGWLASRTADGNPPANPVWVIPGVALCVAVAWSAHFLVEKPFIGGKKKGPKPSPSAGPSPASPS